jgi:hypothetical protein
LTYSVTIHFTTGDRTYQILRNGWTLPQAVGAKGKHATQSLSLSILSTEAFALFATETQRNVKAEVKCDEATVFQGVVRPYLTTSASGVREDAVSMEILDYTELLHYYITADEVVENKNLDATIDYLFEKAGVSTTRSYPTEFSTDSVGYLALSEGEYVDDVLSTLLYERGYDYRFTATRCEFLATTTETEPTQSITDIRGTLSVQRDDDWNEGLSVTYPRAKEDDIVIYSHKKEGSQANIGGTAVSYPGGTKYIGASGLYYDGEQHPGETTPQDGKAKVVWNPQYNEKTDANIKLVGLQNVTIRAWMGDEEGVELTTHLEDVTLTGGRLWLNYSGDFDYHSIPIASWFTSECTWSWIWNIEVRAHVLYLVDDSVEIASESGQRPETSTESLSYIYTEAKAQSYVQRTIKRQKTSSFSYTFKSLTAYAAGSFYKLQDSVTGINQTVRVLSCNQSADGTYSVKAESASTMAISDIGIKKLYYSDMENSGSTAFRISVSKDTLQDAIDISTLTAQGVITASSLVTYKWTLGDTVLGTTNPLAVGIGKLSAGANTITCTAYYNGEEMASTTCTLTRVNAKGQDGKDGSSVEVQYSYSPSADTCYDEFIQWSDSDVYWGTEQALWDTWLANSPAEKEGYYIWMRARIGTADWQYTRLTGVQAKLFNLKCSQSTLTRNQRRDEKAYVTVFAEIQGYINVVPTLKLNGSEVEMNYTEDSGYYYVFGYSLLFATTTTFTLYNGTELMDTLTLKVVDETAKACYFGVSDTAPTQLTASESLLAGDWYLDKSSNIVRIYNGKSWEDMDADAFETGDFTNIEKVSVCLADMIKLGSNESVTATLYGVFKKLCADEAFIKQLKTYFLRVGQGDDTSGFYTQISDVNNAVTFVVKYNGAKVFEIDPTGGDVNFGQSDSGEPIFRYDAETNSIRSLGDNLVMDSSGKIRAKNLAIGEGSTFSGTVTITDMLETRAKSNNKTISASNDGTTATGVSGSQIKANITNRANTLTASTPASDNSLSASGNVMGFSSFDKILRYANTSSGYERIKLVTGTDCETTEMWTWQNTMPFAVKVLSSVDVKSAYHTVETTSYYWVKSGSSVEEGVSVPSDSGDTSVDPTSESDTATEISNVSQISYKPPMYQWTETYYTAGSTTSSEDVYSYGDMYIYVNDSRVSSLAKTAITAPAGATIKLELTGVSDEWRGDVGMWTLQYRGKDCTTGIYLYKSDYSSVARLDTLSSSISSTVSNSLTVNGTVWLDCPLNVSTAWTFNSSYGAIYKLVRFAWSNTETGSATQFSSGAVAQYYDINNTKYNADTVQVVTYTADKLTVAGSGDDIALTVGQWVHSYTLSITAITAPAGVYATNLMPIASTDSVGSASSPWQEVHAQQVNAEGTSNKVYGAKFKGTALFNSTISAGTSYSIADITQYEWITVVADVSYTRGVATFHSSLYSIWNSATNRLVVASDSEYVSIYFTGATSFTVRDKSSSVSKLLIYGYK